MSNPITGLYCVVCPEKFRIVGKLNLAHAVSYEQNKTNTADGQKSDEVVSCQRKDKGCSDENRALRFGIPPHCLSAPGRPGQDTLSPTEHFDGDGDGGDGDGGEGGDGGDGEGDLREPETCGDGHPFLGAEVWCQNQLCGHQADNQLSLAVSRTLLSSSNREVVLILEPDCRSLKDSLLLWK